MFVKQNKSRNGRILLTYTQGYWENGKVKHKNIETIGYLDDLKKKFDDPIAHFKSLAKEKSNCEITELVIKNLNNKTIDMNRTRKNLGYLILKKLYNELNIKEVLNTYQKNTNIEYSLNEILELLIYSRILYPASKKETYHNKDRFFDDFNFSLKNLYRSLDHFSNMKEKIEKTIWNHTKDAYERDTSTVYYDCTNYYFEISYNDEDLMDENGNILEKGYRKKGPSKENKKDPIVSLGLLMDNNGIPLSYTLFPGNESEKVTLRPILKTSKHKFELNRVITVADRGLNTSDNTLFIAGKNDDTTNKDGYIFGQSVLGSDKEFKDYVLNQDNYLYTEETNKNNETFIWKHKSRIFAKTIQIKRDGKRNSKYDIYQKQMVYYSEKYALRQKKQRDLVIEKAKDLIRNPGKYTRATSFGASQFVNNIKYDTKTGSIPDGIELSLNLDKINELEKFDGYYSIVSSELEMSDRELRNRYKGLWEIEESFKITKSQIKSRPVYVWTKQHIEAHFLTCFISLVIIRLLEKRLKAAHPYEKMIESLKQYECSHMEHDIYILDHYDDIIQSIESAFNLNLSKKYLTLSNIKKSFLSIK